MTEPELPKMRGKILVGKETETNLDFSPDFESIQDFTKKFGEKNIRIVSILCPNNETKERFIRKNLGKTEEEMEELMGPIGDEGIQNLCVDYYLQKDENDGFVMILDVSNDLLKTRETMYYFLLKLSSIVCVPVEKEGEGDEPSVGQFTQLKSLSSLGSDVSEIFQALPHVEFYFGFEAPEDQENYLSNQQKNLFEDTERFMELFPSTGVQFNYWAGETSGWENTQLKEWNNYTMEGFVNTLKDLVMLNNMKEVDREGFVKLLKVKRDVNTSIDELYEKLRGFDEKEGEVDFLGSPEKLDRRLRELNESKVSNEALTDIRQKLEALEAKYMHNEALKTLEKDLLAVKLRMHQLEKDILESKSVRVLREKVREARKAGVENEDGFIEVFPDGEKKETPAGEIDVDGLTDLMGEEGGAEKVLKSLEAYFNKRNEEMEKRVEKLENTVLQREEQNVELEKRQVDLEKQLLTEELKRVEEEKLRTALEERVESLEDALSKVQEQKAGETGEEVGKLKENIVNLQERVDLVDKKHVELAEGMKNIEAIGVQVEEDMKTAQLALEKGRNVEKIAKKLVVKTKAVEKRLTLQARENAQKVFDEGIEQFTGDIQKLAEEKIAGLDLQGAVDEKFNNLLGKFKRDLEGKILSYENTQRTSKEEFDIIISEMIKHGKEMDAFKKGMKTQNKLYREKLLKEIDGVLLDFKNRVIVGSFQKGIAGRVTKMEKLLEKHGKFLDGLKRVGISGVGTAPSYKYTKSLYYLEHMTDDFKKQLMRELVKSGHSIEKKKKKKRAKKIKDLQEKKRVPLLRLNKVLEKTKMLQNKREDAMKKKEEGVSESPTEDADESTLSFNPDDIEKAGEFGDSLLEQVQKLEANE